MTDDTAHVALVQQPARVLDSAETMRRGATHIADAAARGAQLIVFPETWVSCYPAWAFGAAGWDDPVARTWHARLLADAVVLGDADDLDDGLSPLRRAAQQSGVTVVVGINERPTPASGTVFNSLVTIGPDGALRNVHRKLTPTHTERIVWGEGDGAGLRVLDTAVGRVGGLVCWEHFHPLARQAMHAQDEQIHVAAWPDMPDMHHVASRMYAAEGRCFVLAVGQYLTVDDVPDDLLGLFRAGLGPSGDDPDVLFDGGSGVVGPDGSWLVPPVRGEATTIHAELPLVERDRMSLDLDVVGHYSRSDVFDLRVDRRRRAAARFTDGDAL
ncbi:MULTISPECIES: carbon-nitrogen hydrolase family protein [unclassified Microbacterium]|uniref:carbon-nitrogen hydrolase family protein n=1 Tax=unclassified Microbacterium TaxID=2609290 RepID=UPI00301A9908